MEANSIQAIKQLAISGMGITLLPRIAVEEELNRNLLVELDWTASNNLNQYYLYTFDMSLLIDFRQSEAPVHFIRHNMAYKERGDLLFAPYRKFPEVLIMPKVYLNPSNENYEFVIGGTDEYYMNKIADAMMPYLRGSGIEVTRSGAGLGVSEAVEESNAGNYDLFIRLASVSSPYFSTGSQQGPIVLYYDSSDEGKEAAKFIVDNFKALYPRPNLVATASNEIYSVLKDNKATAVLLLVGHNANTLDSYWIRDNIDAIGRIIALGVSQYFGIPFVMPQTMRAPESFVC